MAWTRVKNAEGHETSASSATADLGSNPASGNNLSLFGGTDGDRTHNTPTDWTFIAFAVVVSSGSKVSAYWHLSGGDEQTITWTISGGNDVMRMYYREASSDRTIPADPVGDFGTSVDSGDVTDHTTGSVTVTEDAIMETLFMLAGPTAAFDNAWTNSFAQVATIEESTSLSATAGERITTGSVTTDTNEGWITGRRVVSVIVAFEDEAAAAGAGLQMMGRAGA